MLLTILELTKFKRRGVKRFSAGDSLLWEIVPVATIKINSRDISSAAGRRQVSTKMVPLENRLK
jgi:hypothetical protein